MSDATIQSGTTAGSTPKAEKPRIRLAIAEGSTEQVKFLHGEEDLETRIHAVKDDGVEVQLPLFLPRNTKLDLKMDPPRGYALAEGQASIRLTGVVGKAVMVDESPLYRMWVQLEDFDPSMLHAVWIQCRSVDGITLPRRSQSTLTGSPSEAWAQRLVSRGQITKDQLGQAQAQRKELKTELEEVLLGAGLVDSHGIARCKAMELGVPFLDLRSYEVCLENRQLISLDVARKQRLFPLFLNDGVLTLGMADPSDLAVIDQVRLETHCQVEPCLILPSEIDGLIDGARQRLEAPEEGPAASSEDEGPEGAANREAVNQSATVRLVKSIIEEAAQAGASDLHIEPEKDKVRVRIRIDGMMREKATLDIGQHPSLVSRIKVLSKLDIAETRRPQDGHFSMEMGFGNADIRVSTIPTVYGENVVLRLLISDGELLRLEELGMSEELLDRVEGFLDNPHGMLLVTGPTGSGKTTTLYSALERLATPERNVVTVEDPVEKRIQFLRQTEVHVKAGMTFATGLRSILRQDPDVIMVGEIRDEEAAELAVQAALTGHLVLSTLHTNDASGTIVRLNEMGIPPFLITSSLRAVISQRLARKVCVSCAVETEGDLKLARGLGMENPEETRFVQGSGCPECLHTGYRGRVGLYELLELTPGLRSALLDRASQHELEREAEMALFCSLREDGLRRVREGMTTLQEVARVAGLLSGSGSKLEGGA